MSDYATSAYAGTIAILVVCATYALLMSIREARKRRTTEDFITARGSVGCWLLAFSFYAGTMGSWVTTAPASYASTAGLLGLISYSIASGGPLVVAAWAGSLALAADAEATSLPDFLRRRFARDRFRGRLASALALAVMMQNMVLALLAEYSTLGALFRVYVGSSERLAALPVGLMALLTMSYTSFGGLSVSILTDRIQAVCSLALTAVLAAYLLTDRPLHGLPALTTEQAGFTTAGFSSLLTMPISLLCSCLFSEVVWQRVWASDSTRSLQKASLFGAVGVALIVMFFGFIGFLALWTGRAKIGITDPNLYFYAIFSDGPRADLDSVPGLVALLCAALMSEGAADSLQNGITATLSSTLLSGQALWATRILVLAVNVPLAVLGTSPYVGSVLQLFLLSNLACVCCALPLLAALLPFARAHAVTESMLVASSCFGFLGLTSYGWLREGSLASGAWMAWLGNAYAYDYFLVALLSSALCLVFGIWGPTSRSCSTQSVGLDNEGPSSNVLLSSMRNSPSSS